MTLLTLLTLTNTSWSLLQMIQRLLAQHLFNPLVYDPNKPDQQPGLAPLQQQGQDYLQQQTEQQPEQVDGDLQQQQQQQDFLSEKLTMLFLLQVPSAWGLAGAWADHQQHKVWQQLLDASAVSIVEGEVQYLRQQLLHIEDVLHESKQAAAGVDGVTSVGVCSSCPFQLDCQVKGCIKGDLDAGSNSSCHHHIHHHAQQLDGQQQQQQVLCKVNPAAATVGAAPLSAAQIGWQRSSNTDELSGEPHACCS